MWPKFEPRKEKKITETIQFMDCFTHCQFSSETREKIDSQIRNKKFFFSSEVYSDYHHADGFEK